MMKKIALKPCCCPICYCDKSGLYICNDLTDFDVEVIGASFVIPRSQIEHTIRLTCKADDESEDIVLIPLRCEQVDCYTYQGGQTIGSCTVPDFKYGNDASCCYEPPPSLYLCLNNTGLSYEIIDATESGGEWTYTIRITCDADGQTTDIVLDPIKDPDVESPVCAEYDGTGEFVGSCEIGIIEYGNDPFCAHCGADPTGPCAHVPWRPDGYNGKTSTWTAGVFTTWQPIWDYDGFGGTLAAKATPVKEYRLAVTLATGVPLDDNQTSFHLNMNPLSPYFQIGGWNGELACGEYSGALRTTYGDLRAGADFIGGPGISIGDKLEIRIINNEDGNKTTQYWVNDAMVFEIVNGADNVFVPNASCSIGTRVGPENTGNTNFWAGSVTDAFFEMIY